MTDQPEGAPLRSRTVGCICAGDDTHILVEHVYEPEGSFKCEHDGCGRPAHDPGFVGMVVSDKDDSISVILDTETTLALINRLARTVNLIYESDEDPPDIEREAARFSAGAGTP